MISRRAFLVSASVCALAAPGWARIGVDAGRIKVRPVPLGAVRLKPSIYADAVETNRRTLLALSPDRLLHNFHASAGLAPKGERYGGWEARGIAGHTLGHYLTACSLMFAQTGDTAARDRVRAIVAELARIQAAHGDGYIGGTTVERDGEVIDGKIVFEEIRKGDIRTGGFDINGGWVPLYTWHKVHAGLIDAERHGGIAEARPVMLGMAGYLATILEGLDDAAMQKLLAAEYGGLNESYAETHALTRDPRWLRLAERIRDRKILDPLAAGRNILPGLHANTQIPKLIGLARLHELTGDPNHAAAARFFRDTVVERHSYVIGGNSEREHFREPGVIAAAITERTCEACNSYNMLKLTRHLYGWRPDAAHFDFYERTHLNHIMAHQHPETGMFVYFMPLSAGARRTYSTPEDSFWCCVGSGLESHAKHGDSIWWHDDAALYVNLFIPSALDWQGNRVALDTNYPFSETVTLTVDALDRALAIRLPGWCERPALAVNGEAAEYERRGGYAVIDRAWRKGDRVTLTLPMTLRVEPTPDDPDMIAFAHGPVVLAADLGPASDPFESLPPALVTGDTLGRARAVDAAAHRFAVPDAKPAPLSLVPFFAQYDRRTAVYFPRFTQEQWAREEAAFTAAQRAQAALEARTIDRINLGEMQPERDHDYASNHSDLFSFAGRSARQLPWGEGNWLEFDMAVRDGPVVLRVLYWGEETNKRFDISVGGVLLASERRATPPEKRFVGVDYPIPPELTRGRKTVRIRFETRGTDAFIYEVRTLEAAAK
ncbi:glycoside hydrolase family 127 protein [Sphingomonas gilva]|uniref:Glycoside hydrolase family 127 protein n=1 Tax=Sphingomonas gilva TaxID=2305907 RepID=A0A396RQW8_9SPHN|nr:glycoside hydrolase family 127 protein [Sphingomonas gilva]RHW18910.1 glycoside hydrolase family 127 protein [Sphingomonas gilva]